MKIPERYQKGFVQGYAGRGYHLDGKRAGISENWAGGLYQDQYKNWWGWKGNPDKGPQRWGQFGAYEHQSDWDPHWYSRIDPFITDQQKLAELELDHVAAAQNKLDTDIAGVAQQVKDFETKQSEWETDFHKKMSEPRYLNIGDEYVKEDAVAGYIDNLRSDAAFARQRKQDIYNKEMISLANRGTTSGVKTNRGLAGAAQSYSPTGGFNRSSMRIKNTSLNI